MIWNLDAIWLALSISAIGILSFVVALAIDAVMGDDGFGAVGNAFILAGGFVTGILLAEWWRMNLRDLAYVAASGLCGALCCMLILVTIKAALSRL